jgi:hypothetical protein
MGQSGTCAEALVDILSLCEQTLTALREPDDKRPTAALADKYRQLRPQKRANFVRQFVLIQGGLSREMQDSSTR